MNAKDEYCQKHQLTFQPKWSAYRSFAKRLFDLAIILPIFLAILPVLLIAAVLIKLDSRGPVFFLQERLGRYGKTFMTYKFRTMTHREREATSEILPQRSHSNRQLAETVQDRRAAAASEHCQRRHVSGRPSPCPA